jgi:predicted extracellular nuclease
VLAGRFNTCAKEDPIDRLAQAGFTNLLAR